MITSWGGRTADSGRECTRPMIKLPTIRPRQVVGGGVPVQNLSPPGWIRRLTVACLRHRRVAIGSVGLSVVGLSMEALVPLLSRAAVDDAVAGTTARLPALVAGM